jgi:hypothetical protein
MDMSKVEVDFDEEFLLFLSRIGVGPGIQAYPDLVYQ